MAHINTITAVKFTSLAYVDSEGLVSTLDTAIEAAVDDTARASAFRTAFAGDTGSDADESGVKKVGKVREFPSLGTPANIVNVPTYGSTISSQVGGQADAPTLEFTLNYSPAEHAKIDVLRRNKPADGVAFRVRLTDVENLGTHTNGIPGADIAYDDIYFKGQFESFEVTPSLSDSMQLTFSLAIDGDFQGPFSLVGANYDRP